MTPKAFAKKAGVNARTLTRWEIEGSQPHSDTKEKVLATLESLGALRLWIEKREGDVLLDKSRPENAMYRWPPEPAEPLLQPDGEQAAMHIEAIFQAMDKLGMPLEPHDAPALELKELEQLAALGLEMSIRTTQYQAALLKRLRGRS